MSHVIIMELSYTMEDMEGTAGASAEIAQEVIINLLRDHLAGDVELNVTNYFDNEDPYNED